MDPESLAVLREARDTRHRKESVERAVGRAVRRRELDFGVYVRLVSELRVFAEKKKLSLDDALAGILEAQEDKQQ